MKEWSFYHKDTGVLSRRRFMGPDSADPLKHAPEDHLPVEGRHDHQKMFVDLATGSVQEIEHT